jgi:hypothetical protein
MAAEHEVHIDNLGRADPAAEANSLPCSVPEDEEHRLNQGSSERRGLPGWALNVLVGLGGVLTLAWNALLVHTLIRAVTWLFT